MRDQYNTKIILIFLSLVRSGFHGMVVKAKPISCRKHSLYSSVNVLSTTVLVLRTLYILASLTGDVEMTILCSHPSHIEDTILASLTGDVQMTILCRHSSHTRSSRLEGKGKIFISHFFFLFLRP